MGRLSVTSVKSEQQIQILNDQEQLKLGSNYKADPNEIGVLMTEPKAEETADSLRQGFSIEKTASPQNADIEQSESSDEIEKSMTENGMENTIDSTSRFFAITREMDSIMNEMRTLDSIANSDQNFDKKTLKKRKRTAIKLMKANIEESKKMLKANQEELAMLQNDYEVGTNKGIKFFNRTKLQKYVDLALTSLTIGSALAAIRNHKFAYAAIGLFLTELAVGTCMFIFNRRSKKSSVNVEYRESLPQRIESTQNRISQIEKSIESYEQQLEKLQNEEQELQKEQQDTQEQEDAKEQK